MNAAFTESIIHRGTLLNGRYRPLSVLGRGGMGWVLQAEDSLLQSEPVVLKFLYPHLLSEEQSRLRLRSEVLLARRLVHHNIVRTYTFTNDEIYGDNIVMEYVAGRTLRDVLGNPLSPELPLQQVLGYLRDILRGIEHAHALGVIHLDLKPENILLTKDGEAKIADFGLAQSLRIGERASGLSGTPIYMAPEQFDNGVLTPQTDLYAIGILTFELLTGRPPFEGSSLYQLANKHCLEQLPSLQTLRPDLPSWVEEMLLHCVEKSSSERFDSAGSILRALRTFAPDLEWNELSPVESRAYFERISPSSESHPLLSFWRRKKLRLAVLSSLVALFCVFARNIGWLHAFLLLCTLHMEKASGQTMHISRYLFRIKAVPSESYYVAIGEAGAVAGLLSIGKDPDELEPITLRSILCSLSEGGMDLDTLEWMLNHGANPDRKGGDGNASLHVVRGSRSSDIAELLLSHGANPNLRNESGATPLIWAIQSQNLPLVRTLLAWGADPLFPDFNGTSALDLAKKIDGDRRFQEILQEKVDSLSRTGQEITSLKNSSNPAPQ